MTIKITEIPDSELNAEITRRTYARQQAEAAARAEKRAVQDAIAKKQRDEAEQARRKQEEDRRLSLVEIEPLLATAEEALTKAAAIAKKARVYFEFSIDGETLAKYTGTQWDSVQGWDSSSC